MSAAPGQLWLLAQGTLVVSPNLAVAPALPPALALALSFGRGRGAAFRAALALELRLRLNLPMMLSTTGDPTLLRHIHQYY